MKKITIFPTHYQKGFAIVTYHPGRDVMGGHLFGLVVQYCKQRRVSKQVDAAWWMLNRMQASEILVELSSYAHNLTELVNIVDIRLNNAKASTKPVPKLVEHLYELSLAVREVHNSMQTKNFYLELDLSDSMFSITLETPSSQFINPLFQEVLHEIEKWTYSRLKDILETYSTPAGF